VAVGLCTLT
jgi:WD40 repeat protein